LIIAETLGIAYPAEAQIKILKMDFSLKNLVKSLLAQIKRSGIYYKLESISTVEQFIAAQEAFYVALKEHAILVKRRQQIVRRSEQIDRFIDRLLVPKSSKRKKSKNKSKQKVEEVSKPGSFVDNRSDILNATEAESVIDSTEVEDKIEERTENDSVPGTKKFSMEKVPSKNLVKFEYGQIYCHKSIHLLSNESIKLSSGDYKYMNLKDGVFFVLCEETSVPIGSNSIGDIESFDCFDYDFLLANSGADSELIEAYNDEGISNAYALSHNSTKFSTGILELNDASSVNMIYRKTMNDQEDKREIIKLRTKFIDAENSKKDPLTKSIVKKNMNIKPTYASNNPYEILGDVQEEAVKSELPVHIRETSEEAEVRRIAELAANYVSSEDEEEEDSSVDEDEEEAKIIFSDSEEE